MAVYYLAIQCQLAHRRHFLCIAVQKPVHDINVMRAFLKQHARRFLPLSVPVFEIGISAIGDKVPAPTHFRFANRAGIDKLLHLLNDREVPHVVTDIQLALMLHRGFEDAITTLDSNGHRLF